MPIFAVRPFRRSTTPPDPSDGATGGRDEAGTPWCVTVDGQTLEDGTVTIRDRDTLEQIRVTAESVPEWVRGRLAGH